MIEDIVKKGLSQPIAQDLLIKDQQIILLLYLVIGSFLKITYCRKLLHKIFHMNHLKVEASFLKGTKD